MSVELEEFVRNQAAEIARLSDAVQSLRLQVEEMKRATVASDALTGDCNLTPDSGFIEVDRNVSSHPVVRFRSDLFRHKQTPSNFDPVFAADEEDKIKLSGVGSGYCPFGRAFYYVDIGSQLDSSALIETGLIYLEVQHPGPSGSDPTFTVKGGSPSFANTDTTKTLIPLYSISNGEIVADYRYCMSLPMREL